MSFLYRSGTIDDIEDVFHLNRDVFDEAWSKNVMLQSLQVGYDLYVCHEGDLLVGYVLSQDILLEAQVMQVCVHTGFRRKGVARRLMSMLLQGKQDMGSVMLEVRVSNVAAQSFYHSLGFETSGIRPNYYSKTKSKPREDAAVMTLLGTR